MIAIRDEVRAIEKGKAARDNNLLAMRRIPCWISRTRNGSALQPRTSLFPLQSLQRDKYWCPVNRIDNVYGDRNLFCSCPSIQELQEAAE